MSKYIDILNEEIEKLKKENGELKKENGELKKENGELKKEVDIVYHDSEDWRESNIKLINVIGCRNLEIYRLKDDIKKLKHELKSNKG